jgi:hypothetical protein
MKRLLPQMLVMAITFGLGLSFAWILAKPPGPAAKVEPVAPKVVETVVPVFVPTPFPTPTPPTFVLDYDPKSFYPDGTYYIIGKKPKEFRELDSFEMWFDPENPQQFGNITAYVVTDTTSAGQNAVFGFVSKRRLFFVTQESTKGFAYRFDGEFVRTDTENVEGTNIVVMRGKLTKSKKGRTIVERVVSFRLERHSC